MYNYQQHQRHQKLSNEYRKAYREYLDENAIRKSKNGIFYSSHRKRIDAYVLGEIQCPVEVEEWVSRGYEPRGKSGTGQGTSFKMNSHTTSQRLQPIIQKNSYLDCTPTPHPSSHSFRSPSVQANHQKNLHERPFKFTASCTAVRLMDHLMNSRLNQVEMERFSTEKSRMVLRVKRNMEKFEPEDRKPNKQIIETLSPDNSRTQVTKYKPQLIPNKNMKELTKILMPGLHRKAYYNSMKSLLVEQPGAHIVEFLENQRDMGIGMSMSGGIGGGNGERYDLEERDGRKNKIKSKAYEHINRKENAITAMIRCKLMKPRNGDDKTGKGDKSLSGEKLRA